MTANQKFVQKLIASGLYKPKNMTEKGIEDFLSGLTGFNRHTTNECVKQQGKCQK